MKYQPHVDGLRAVAVFAVILFHFDHRILPGGFLGVDVFFVISGFVITKSILHQLSNNKFSLRNFYIRRILRLSPLLLFMILLVTPVSWYMLPPWPYQDYGQSLVSTILYASNFLFYIEGGYFDTPGLEKPLFHIWSLSVEEQFYLLFPVTFYAFYRIFRDQQYPIPIALISLLSLIGFLVSGINEAFYFTWLRIWEFGVGFLAATLPHYRKSQSDNLLSLMGLLIIILLFQYLVGGQKIATLLIVLGSYLVITYSSYKTISWSFLTTRSIVFVGIISYGLYIWHYPILSFYRIYSESQKIAIHHALVLFLVIFSISILTWLLIERPFRGQSKLYNIPQKTGLLIIFLVSILLLIFGIHAHVSGGYPDRFKLSKIQNKYLNTALPMPNRKICHAGQADIKIDKPCVWGGDNVSYAVLGDSHAAELAYSLGKIVKDKDQGVMQLSRTGCRPTFESNYDACSIWMNNAVRFLEQKDYIKTVIISFNINAALFGGHYDTYPSLPDQHTDSYRNSLMQEFFSMTSKLAESKNIIIAFQAPELPKYMDYLIYRLDNSLSDIAGVEVDWWNKRAKYFYTQSKIFDEKVGFIDPANIFCDNNFCYAGKKGVSYYYDHNHMSVAGALEIAREALKVEECIKDNLTRASRGQPTRCFF